MRGVHLSYIAGSRAVVIHSRDVTYATSCQGPYEESARYRDFLGWAMPWHSASRDSLDTLLVERRVGMMDIVLRATRIQGLRDFLDDEARRRGDG
jgi:hypothetical protein